MLVSLLLIGFSIGIVLGIEVVLYEATSVLLFVQQVQHRAKTRKPNQNNFHYHIITFYNYN